MLLLEQRVRPLQLLQSLNLPTRRQRQSRPLPHSTPSRTCLRHFDSMNG